MEWLNRLTCTTPAEVIDNPSMVDWRNERPDRLFALVHGVASLSLSKPELWERLHWPLPLAPKTARPT